MTPRRLLPLAAAALGLAGCGDGAGVSARSPERSDPPRSARAMPLIGVSFDVEQPLRAAELRALQDAAALRGARLRVLHASGDAGAQHDQVLRLLDLHRVDAIVAVAQDRLRIHDAIRAANARGVPFVAFDRAPAPDFRSRLAGKVTSDPVADGHTAGRALQRLDEPLRVLHLWGALTDASALGRRDGLNAQLGRGQVQVVAQARTGGVPARARQATLDALRDNPSIDAVFVPSDFVLPAVLGALRTLGRLAPDGAPGHVHVVSVGGAPAGCAALRAGYVDADVAIPVGELSRQALDAALTAVKRPDAPAREVAMPGTLVRKDGLRRAWGCR